MAPFLYQLELDSVSYKRVTQPQWIYHTELCVCEQCYKVTPVYKRALGQWVFLNGYVSAPYKIGTKLIKKKREWYSVDNLHFMPNYWSVYLYSFIHTGLESLLVLISYCLLAWRHNDTLKFFCFIYLFCAGILWDICEVSFLFKWVNQDWNICLNSYVNLRLKKRS